jgi:hypothetical protein
VVIGSEAYETLAQVTDAEIAEAAEAFGLKSP